MQTDFAIWPSPPPSLARLVDSIGSNVFDAQLIHCLHEISGADHCAVYALNSDRVELLAAASINGSDHAQTRGLDYASSQSWRGDSGFLAAYGDSSMPRATLVRARKSYSARGRPQVYDKLFLYGIRSHLYGISVLRDDMHNPRFCERDLQRLSVFADMAFSCVDQHVRARERAVRALAPLGSVEIIESSLQRRTLGLSRRELQVCARILYGLPLPEIARDLGINPESVVTYKRRAFLKAKVSGRHELMRLYLES
ncbi:helix-turn-helix transcriptional regulator [Verticiella sediminum]|uniref:Helix-turn-helix transcriptional regulator n=1 Tax=Verticiella sediminum TaxID=1247510 RepID=A0A556AZI4_9BURK|nr:helix-turn-helix transcriptional regulator [Verticiella sediminum]TSH98324.1 helix-turn-helix transcriptional regulator [Verticiella sediminum]